ncbi:hypothetical protein B0T16DRAFT_405274 [Cercophora newfieldiana]|uniref:Uncharacterized protein n=1 Tax=Cercophora newfieldiana TaxID=92897 RepID=A0AA39YID6_9PEZI|nr:hypothetical protein B0T16DRAFT_405274 [Cercophora newfieldiana]
MWASIRRLVLSCSRACVCMWGVGGEELWLRRDGRCKGRRTASCYLWILDPVDGGIRRFGEGVLSMERYEGVQGELGWVEVWRVVMLRFEDDAMRVGGELRLRWGGFGCDERAG